MHVIILIQENSFFNLFIENEQKPTSCPLTVYVSQLLRQLQKRVIKLKFLFFLFFNLIHHLIARKIMIKSN